MICCHLPKVQFLIWSLKYFYCILIPRDQTIRWQFKQSNYNSKLFRSDTSRSLKSVVIVVVKFILCHKTAALKTFTWQELIKVRFIFNEKLASRNFWCNVCVYYKVSYFRLISDTGGIMHTKRQKIYHVYLTHFI